MRTTSARLVAAWITLSLSNVGEVQAQGWSIPFYGSEAEPIVYDGILYVGSSRGELHAIELASGKTRWIYPTGVDLPFSAPSNIDAPEPAAGVEAMSQHLADPWPARRVINATALVDQGAVFLSSEDRGFYALDAQSGALRWRVDLPRSAARAASAAGLVVFTAANQVLAYGHDGDSAWSYELYPDVPDELRDAPSAPIVIDETVYVAGRIPDPKARNKKRMFLVALDARSGALRWLYQASNGYVQEPVIANGLAFLSTPYPEGVTAVDTGTGVLRWRFDADLCTANVSRPMLAGGRVIFATDRARYGLEPETGKLAWHAAGHWYAYIFGKRASGTRVILAVDRDGKLDAVDAVSGQTRWSASPGPEPRVLAMGEAIAYVASQEVVVAVDLENGKTLWKLGVGAEVSSGPMLVEGKACFASGVSFTVRHFGFVPVEGRLVCVDARTGKF